MNKNSKQSMKMMWVMMLACGLTHVSYAAADNTLVVGRNPPVSPTIKLSNNVASPASVVGKKLDNEQNPVLCKLLADDNVRESMLGAYLTENSILKKIADLNRVADDKYGPFADLSSLTQNVDRFKTVVPDAIARIIQSMGTKEEREFLALLLECMQLKSGRETEEDKYAKNVEEWLKKLDAKYEGSKENPFADSAEDLGRFAQQACKLKGESFNNAAVKLVERMLKVMREKEALKSEDVRLEISAQLKSIFGDRNNFVKESDNLALSEDQFKRVDESNIRAAVLSGTTDYISIYLALQIEEIARGNKSVDEVVDSMTAADAGKTDDADAATSNYGITPVKIGLGFLAVAIVGLGAYLLLPAGEAA